MSKLLSAAADRPKVTVLLDPDTAGRQGRWLLDEALPGCLHAFVPADDARHACTPAALMTCGCVHALIPADAARTVWHSALHMLRHWHASFG